MIIDSPIISGSYSASGSLNQFGNVVVSGSLTVTGSIIGTASYAATASYLSGYVSPFPYTGSAIISGSLEVTGSANIPNLTGSLSGSLNGTASYAVTASNALTASYLSGYVSPFPFTGSAIISGSLEITGSASISNLLGSGVRYLVADESGSITAQSASAALKATQEFTSTAGQTTFSVTNGYATGYVDVFINGSKLSTAEFTDTSGTNIVLATGSFSGDVVEVVKYTPAAGVTNNVLRQLTTLTGSAGQTVFSASYTPGLIDIFYNGSRLSTSDYTANNGTYFTLATGSVDGDILDVLVYSYQVGAFNGIGGQGVVNQLAFFNTTSSITGSNSFTVSGNTLVGTASYALNADTLDGTHLSTLATTGSNTFTSAQYISNTSTPIGFTDTASLYTDGGLRATKTSYFSSSVYIGGDLVIFGSQSVNYITSSQLNIADNIITVNTSSPAVRFGGIAVQDSGSLATGLTGSLLWDSQNNHWIYSNPSGSSYSGGMLISGPRNTGSIGDEQGTTFNALMKGQGGDHITSSGIFESSSFVGIGTSTPLAKLDVKNDDGVADGLHVIADFNKSGSSSAELILGYYASASAVIGPVVYAANSQPLLFAAGGSEKVRITSTGSVGIGTTTPTGSLTVQSMVSASTSGPIVAVRTSFTSKNIIAELAEYSSDGALILRHALATTPTVFITSQTGGSSVTYFNHEGNISIGTTTPVSTNLKGALTIVKSYNGDSTNGATTQAYYSNQSALYLFGRNSGLSIISNNSEEGKIAFGNNSAAMYASIVTGTGTTSVGGDMYFKVGSDTERMRITTGGNVGIGTNNPLAKLDIKMSGDGDIFVGRFSGGSAKLVYAYQSGADGFLELRTGADSTITKLSGYSGTPSYFLSNVLVGQTTGDLGQNGWQLQAAGGGHTSFAINNNEAFIFNNRNTGTTYEIDFRTNVIERGKISVTDSGVSYITTPSDLNLKKNFEDWDENVLNNFKNLNPQKFNFATEEDDQPKTKGFIAQELVDYFPEAYPKSKNRYFFNPSGMVVYLMKAIQEQQTLIQELQEKLERNNIN